MAPTPPPWVGIGYAWKNIDLGSNETRSENAMAKDPVCGMEVDEGASVCISSAHHAENQDAGSKAPSGTRKPARDRRTSEAAFAPDLRDGRIRDLREQDRGGFSGPKCCHSFSSGYANVIMGGATGNGKRLRAGGR